MSMGNRDKQKVKSRILIIEIYRREFIRILNCQSTLLSNTSPASLSRLTGIVQGEDSQDNYSIRKTGNDDLEIHAVDIQM